MELSDCSKVSCHMKIWLDIDCIALKYFLTLFAVFRSYHLIIVLCSDLYTVLIGNRDVVGLMIKSSPMFMARMIAY